MCGILGVRRSWLPDRGPVEAALDAMAWRGPDGSKLREVGDWFLGVARLAITDAAAEQPIVCPSTGRVALLNGALTSAAREWPRYGVRARTRNDAELLLLRLQARGPAALGDMTGPHAFAVVEPSSDTLWLGRDAEGEKPLLVVTAGRRVVAFASCAASLRQLGLAVRLAPDEQARFLRYGFHLGPSIPSLPSLGESDGSDGLRLEADLRGVQVDAPERPTALEPVPGALEWVPAAGEPVPGGGTGSSAAPLAERLAAAVARCATAEVPLGACLSGGIDSSCIALCLRDLGLRLPAYQFRARGAPGGERALAQAVAAATGQRLRPVDAGPEVLAALPALTEATGLPQGDPSVLAVHALARAAAADGVRVLLSGEGADDLLLGYPRHRAAAFLPARGAGALPAPGLGTGRLARLWRALAADTPYDALLEVAPPGFRRAVLAPELWSGGALPGAGMGEPSLHRARRIDRACYLRFDLLPKLDTALMAAGVEGRCPFLDGEVLAAPEVREPDPRRVLGKRALRRAFAGRLPGAVARQRKRGFALPLDRWLREDDFVADLLLDRRTLARGHLCAAGLRRMLDLHRRGGARLGHALYLVAAWELYERACEASVRRPFEPVR